MAGDPPRRVLQTGTHVATTGTDLPGDQREEPLGIRAARRRRPLDPEPGVERVQALDDPVVGEEPSIHAEGVGVARYETAGGGVPHMGAKVAEPIRFACCAKARSW
jgi:hypothetical protein